MLSSAGIIQLSLTVFPVMEKLKSLTFGGRLPMGGSGGAFLPHPENRPDMPIPVTTARTITAKTIVFVRSAFIIAPLLISFQDENQEGVFCYD